MPWKILSSPSSHRATGRGSGGRTPPRKLDMYMGSSEADGWTQTFLFQLSHLRQYDFTTYTTADFNSAELVNFDYFNGKWHVTQIKNNDVRFCYNGVAVLEEQLPIQLKREDELTILANAEEDWLVFFQVIDFPLVTNAPHTKSSQFQLYSGDYQEIMHPAVPPVNEGVPELVPFPYQQCLENSELLTFLMNGAILPVQVEQLMQACRDNIREGDNEMELDISYGRSPTCLRFRFPCGPSVDEEE